jgi:hypothetical protein
MNGVTKVAQSKITPHLLFDSAVHALEHPDNPAPFDDFADESKRPRFGRTHTLLLRPYGEEVLEEPFRDKEQAKVVLLCDFWALRFDILE